MNHLQCGESISTMANKKRRLYINLVLKFLLIITGNIPTSIKYLKVQRIGVLFGIFSYVSSIHSVIWSVMNTSNITVISESLSIFMMLISSFVMFCIIPLRKHLFVRAIQSIDGEPEDVIEEINTKFFDILKILLELIIVIETSYFLTGIITTSSSDDVKLGTQESLYFPWYIPWDYYTPMKYILSLVYEFLIVLYPFTINYATFAALAGFYAYINHQFVRLLEIIDKLENCQKLIPQSGPRNEYNHELIQVIKSYQQWKSLSKEFASYFGDFSGAVLFCVILCSVWNISLLTENEIPISVKIKNICLLLYIIIQLIIICLMGEYFQKKDDEIRNALYNTSWYKSFDQSKKTFIGFMLLTQTATQVRAYGMMPVNTNLILRVLRIIYSALNLYNKAGIK